MIDCKNIDKLLHTSNIKSNDRIYASSRDLKFAYFFHCNENGEKIKLLVNVYFKYTENENIDLVQTIIMYQDNFITYKYDKIDSKEKYNFYNPIITEELNIDSSMSKDELFNISVQYGITESDLDLIRKWNSHYTKLFTSTLYKFQKTW